MHAQQAPQHSLYMVDPYSINPAYAGFDKSLSANLNYRGQWTGIDQNPAQIFVNTHLPIYLLDGGAGIQIRRDRTGLVSRTEINVSYNRVIPTIVGTLSAGLRIGLQQSRFDGTQVITPDGEYINSTINHNDPTLPDNNVSTISPTWTAGLFFRNDYLDLGLTISDFVPGSLQLDNIQLANNKLVNFYTQMPLKVKNIEVLPSVLIKSDFNYVQTDLSILVKSGNIFGGTSIRGYNSNSFDSLVILGGIQLNENYAVAYSYDVGINALRNATQGTHELHINYNLNKLIGIGLPPAVIYNPRNL